MPKKCKKALVDAINSVENNNMRNDGASATGRSSKRKLSELEREVLSAAQLRAGWSIAKLAKQCKRPAHQVRYALAQLTGDGIIRVLPSLNLHALGWTYGSLHFTTSSRQPLSPQDVIRKLRAVRQITYVSCFSTEPQYEVSFAVESLLAAQGFADELARLLPIAERVLAFRVEGALCGRKYLSEKGDPGPPIVSARPAALVEIDETDRKLLHLLVNEAASSLPRIAALAGLPETTARIRIRKLEEMNVIVGYRYHLQNDRFPILDFKMLLTTASSSPAFRAKLEAFADRHKNVVYRSTCLGPWEFELDVECELAEEAAALCHEIRGRFPNEITRIQSLPRFYSQSFLGRLFM